MHKTSPGERVKSYSDIHHVPTLENQLRTEKTKWCIGDLLREITTEIRRRRPV